MAAGGTFLRTQSFPHSGTQQAQRLTACCHALRHAHDTHHLAAVQAQHTFLYLSLAAARSCLADFHAPSPLPAAAAAVPLSACPLPAAAADAAAAALLALLGLMTSRSALLISSVRLADEGLGPRPDGVGAAARDTPNADVAEGAGLRVAGRALGCATPAAVATGGQCVVIGCCCCCCCCCAGAEGRPHAAPISPPSPAAVVAGAGAVAGGGGFFQTDGAAVEPGPCVAGLPRLASPEPPKPWPADPPVCLELEGPAPLLLPLPAAATDA